MKRYFSITLTVALLCITSSCGSSISFKTFSKDGLKIEYPTLWIPLKSNDWPTKPYETVGYGFEDPQTISVVDGDIQVDGWSPRIEINIDRSNRSLDEQSQQELIIHNILFPANPLKKSDVTDITIAGLSGKTIFENSGVRFHNNNVSPVTKRENQVYRVFTWTLKNGKLYSINLFTDKTHFVEHRQMFTKILSEAVLP